MEGPLSGIRVLDLSQYVAGPYCGRLLAGFGADVIKIEPPEGDPIRHWGPFRPGEDDPNGGVFHLYLDQGKRSVVLDLDRPEDQARLRDLVATADILIESFRPGRLAEIGFGYEDLESEFPGLLYLSITPFGQDGPYADYHAWEITTYALGGLMYITGEPDREPLKNGGYPGQYGAGQNAYVAVLAALWERSISGIGQHIDVSVHEHVASLLEMTDMTYIYGGEVHPRTGNGARAAWGIYPCADGFIGVVSGPLRRWANIAELMENPVLADVRYQRTGAQSELRDEIDAHMLPWLITHEKEDIYHRAQALGLPFGYVSTPADFFKSEQIQYRGFFHELDHPVAGPLRNPSIAAHFTDGLWESRRAPLLGEHTEEVLASPPPARSALARSKDTPPPLRPGQQGPLTGIVVLDCSMVWAGPYCTKLLADLGATVIKVEANRQLDSVRGPAIPPPVPLAKYANDDPGEEPWNRSGYFNKYNRNKLGMCMNILQPEGREVFMELAAIADVVIENFGGGVFERMGFGYEVLREVNEDLIFVSMPPSGNGGPEARYVGYGVAIEQLGGIVARTGYRGDDMPMKTGINYGDPIAGIHTAGYIMTALLHRERTGRGQYIDVSQRECTINWLGESVLEYQVTGENPAWMGNRDRFMAPSGAYRCAGEDAWVALAVGSDAEWDGLCAALGREDLCKRYPTNQLRAQHHDEIDEAISAWTASLDADDAMRILQGHGVAAGVCAENRRVVHDPHLAARGFWPEVEHVSAGRHIVAGVAWQYSRTPGAVYAAAPALGQHTEYVLREILGKGEGDIQRLRDSGVLENTPEEILALRERVASESSG